MLPSGDGNTSFQTVRSSKLGLQPLMIAMATKLITAKTMRELENMLSNSY